MTPSKLVWGAVAVFVATLLSCHGKNNGPVETVEIPSLLLGKTMRISVYLPDGYSPTGEYPVLYFIPYGGGGPGAITYIAANDRPSREYLRSEETKKFLIVGVPHDGSFLLDSDPPHDSITIEEGIVLHRGYYESFFLEEVIPFIEEHYAVSPKPADRYIGGYSMGGYAALRIALTYPGLFSRVGAHSPTLVEGSLPDESVTRFMYPDEVARALRDPLILVETLAIDTDTRFFLDTDPADVNRTACDRMARSLSDRGAQIEYHVFGGTHGLAYFSQYFVEYLEFYGRP